MTTRVFRKLAGIAVPGLLLVIALLMRPDPAYSEAQMNCTGQPSRVFEDMTACSVRMSQGCSCTSEPNPWAARYWLAVSVMLGVLAAWTISANFVAGALLLTASLFASGTATLYALLQLGLIDGVSAGHSIGNLVVLVVIAFIAFTLSRYAKSRLATRSTAA
jgi:hypothetical protein